MRIQTGLLSAVLSLLLAACGTSSSTVAVQGSDVDLTLLAGKWEGTYEGAQSGRKGTVSFDLYTGYRVAEGKVMMNALADPANARELSIKFMQIGGRKLTGNIDPYTDPQCNCTVETEFIGTLKGDQISGVFHTGPAGAPKSAGGTWTATRKK